MATIEKILVVGAKEKTGLEIIKKAIHEELDVTALVRQQNEIPPELHDPKLKIEIGDESKFEEVEKWVKGQDAVLSALDSPKLLQGCKNIIEAMKKHNVTKLVVISTAQLFSGKKTYFWGKKKWQDHAKQLEILEQESNSIEWVAMMPGKIKDDESIEPDYKVEKNNTPGANEVTKAELADFMVKVFMDRTSIECFRHTKLGISSRPKTSRMSFWRIATAVGVVAIGILLYYTEYPSILKQYLDGTFL